MEGAARVLAGEFSRSTLGVPDEDRNMPGWVVTPGGAWCRQIVLVGALTEVVDAGDLCRCRVADPSGVFDIVLWGRNATLVQTLNQIPVPSFVAITGSAQIYRKNTVISLSVRPEQVRVIDRIERDRLLLISAEYSLRRFELMAQVLEGRVVDERMKAAIVHYATTAPALLELTAMVEAAVNSIRSPAAHEGGPRPAVSAMARELIANAAGPRGIAVEEVIGTLGLQGIAQEEVLAVLESLVREDECYQPQKGYVKLL